MTLSSFTLATWLFGFVGALWTHNVYVVPSIYCTFQYGVVWLATTHRDASATDQIHLHVTHLVSMYLGILVGSVAMLTQKTRVAVGVNVIRRRYIEPFVALWCMGIITLSTSYMFAVHAYQPLMSKDTQQIASILFLILGSLLIVPTSYVQWTHSGEQRQNLVAQLLLTTLVLSTQLYDALATSIRPYHIPLMIFLWLMFYYTPLLYAMPSRSHFIRLNASVHLIVYSIIGIIDELESEQHPGTVLFALLVLSIVLIVCMYVNRRPTTGVRVSTSIKAHGTMT